MADKKISWDNRPSIESLAVDWEFEPENPQGKRECIRIKNSELHSQLMVEKIPVKAATLDWNGTGYLLDMSQKGIAVMLRKNIDIGGKIKVGLVLGRHKIFSKGIVRSNVERGKYFRIGVKFVDLPPQSKEYISGLVSSKIFNKY